MSSLRQLKSDLKQSGSYQQWLDTATKIDLMTGKTNWRQHIKSDDYPYELLNAHTKQLHSFLAEKNYIELSTFVKESLYLTLGELSKPQLYQQALCGTKACIERYLDLIILSLNTLCDEPLPGLDEHTKLKQLIQAEKNFGRPALMLSGGGTFGIYHNGVISTLIDHGLLPNVISGTSMGSITAGMIACFHDHELKAILATPENSHYKPLKRLNLSEIWLQKALLDPKQLQSCLEANIGNCTFLDAFKKTGREVSITVSPAHSGQKPRILNYQTSPNVLIASAAKASCSVPGLFPASQLLEQNEQKEIVPYLKGELWVDGSFASDIPRRRISRLHNVNFFIVSQTNPHILPFVSHRQKTGVAATLTELTIASIYAQGNSLLKVARRRLNKQPWGSWLNHASFLLDQDYLGDIDIHPDFPPNWYLKFMVNPSDKERDYLLKMGERATWPKLGMIRDQTRISRTLQDCIQRLTMRLADKKITNDQTEIRTLPGNKMNKPLQV